MQIRTVQQLSFIFVINLIVKFLDAFVTQSKVSSFSIVPNSNAFKYWIC
jgi:hypothetical protein